MKLDFIKDRLKAIETQGQKKEKKEKIDYAKYIWKPKQAGEYKIRFVPSKLFKDEQFQEVLIHYGFTKYPIYSLVNWGEKDPIVEFVKKLKETKDKENWKLAYKLSPKSRFFTPIIVRGEEDKGVRLWEFGKEIYKQLLGIADDDDYGDYTDIHEGRDFTLKVIESKVGNNNNSLTTTLRIKPKTSSLSENKKDVEKWLEEQPDLLSIQYKTEYDKLKGILEKWLNPEEAGANDSDTSKSENKDNNDLPWAKEEEQPVIKTPTPKKSNSDKFEALFEEEPQISQE